MLPAIFKAILQLCGKAHEYNSSNDEELCDDPSVTINHDAEYQKIIEGSWSSESHDYINEENYFLFKNYEKVLYDSPFLNIDQNKLIKEIIKNLSRNYPEIMNSIKGLLTKNEGKFLNSLIQ